jgi:hypothetical protein
MRDFAKFTCFVKGMLETGTVIKYSDMKLRHDVKLYFNRLMTDAAQFEKFLHKEIGADMAEAEESINESITQLVWQIFDMPEEQLKKFFEHLNKFEEE